MKTCRIVPKTRRAKNRVKEHGDTFELVKEGRFKGTPATLVRALETPEGQEPWMGWFCENEAQIHEKQERQEN